jgi:NADH-quinone oxidoreductase subunit G
LLPTLLPGGRPVADAAARVDTAAIWDVAEVPAAEGRDASGMLASAAAHDLKALVVGGVRTDDLPRGADAALRDLDFLVVLDTHDHELVELADVVFPVAAAPEKSGTFLNWEGRERRSERVRRTALMSDGRVLAALADQLDVSGFPRDVNELGAQLAEFAGWEGARVSSPETKAGGVPDGSGLVLATWRPLLESDEHMVMQEGEPYLAATARPQQIWLSASEAELLGAGEGQLVTVTSETGSVAAPLVITDVAEGAVVVTGDAHRVLCGHGGTGGERVQVAVGGTG